MPKIIYFKGATCWEAAIGKLWITIPFRKYRRLGCKIRIGWDCE